MMWKLVVLPLLVLIIPPVLVLVFYLLADRADGSEDRSLGGTLDSAPTSSIPMLEARISSWRRNVVASIPLEKTDRRLRGQVHRAACHLAQALVLGITVGACVIGLLAVGLVRGAAARSRMISNFGFSSPTKFLIARNGLAAVLVFTWVTCFLPIQGALIAFVWCILAGMTLLFSLMLAKQFPVVW
jgi:hypothetical protein